MSEDMTEKKQKAAVEALLFATNGQTVDEIVKRTGIQKRQVKHILEELELEHLHDARGIHVINEGDVWKMSVKPEMTPQVKDLLPPEFPKSLLKTLAIIAAKKPVKQSIVVRIRGNKAYNHINKLLKLGFITAEMYGNTKMLDLTQKFFEYFHVKEVDIKTNFKLDKETEEEIKKAEQEEAQAESKSD